LFSHVLYSFPHFHLATNSVPRMVFAIGIESSGLVEIICELRTHPFAQP
jgi:hypothetical protein